ncbi:PTS glucose transporter subunit IIABC [Williamsoniiplasma lucivorax]|uniref:PTS system, beta-glucoside-specific IIABC component n=1 Tax=Williamsoniiplasma lucivorax TaxID=209274 RepID=A0A2S5REP2_9MOLU|nr:PTS glucose transporter subunit IIABC [Williamsoniiplasma lucivorax]PPE05767.1 PTS system, beta-glucoside-specific IIABC component [Williamsoniiplasma lucivorax]
MENIKIYAPVDADIDFIEKCSDLVFSEKNLGDGFLIIPKKNNFQLPFDFAKIKMIFPTKHAIGFELNNGLNALLHCGLETVHLNGEPFTYFVEEGDEVRRGDKIFDVNLTLLKKLKVSAETPLIFELNQNEQCVIKNFKPGFYKQGELIAELSIQKNEVNPQDEMLQLFESGSQFENLAKNIDNLVGTKTNYNDVYNCMTRLRFDIINPNLVNIDQIKKEKLVKNVRWNGQELQIIIGAEAAKIKDAVIDYNKKLNDFELRGNKNINKDTTLGKKFVATFMGIMVPLIPIFIGTGIIQAIIGILQLTDVMPTFVITSNPETISQIANLKGIDIWWFLLNAVGKSSSLFVGIIVAYSASKYFDFNRMLGVTLGVIICSPLLFVNGGLFTIGGDWTLFRITTINIPDNPKLTYFINNLFNIRITPGNIKIFVIIFAILFGLKLDNWLKKRITSIMELMFKGFVIILLVSMVSLGIMTPIWNFLEALFGLLFYFIGLIPGIGVGFYAGIAQIGVIFAMQAPLGIITSIQTMVDLGLGLGGYSVYSPGASISVWAQVGALIGVIIVTKNANLRRTAIGMIPIGILGVTEPFLYGINLPKKRPFLAAISAAAIAGTFASLIGVTGRVGTGMGIFEAVGFFQWTVADPNGAIGLANGQLTPIANGLWYVVSCLIAIGGAILFTIFSYKEYVNAKNKINMLLKQVFTFISWNSKMNSTPITKEQLRLLKEELNQLKKEITKEELLEIKILEKQIIKQVKFKSKLLSNQEKEAKEKEKIISKGQKDLSRNKVKNAEQLFDKYKKIDYSALNLALEKNIKHSVSQDDIARIETLILEKNQVFSQKIQNILQNYKINNLDLDNNIYNSLNSMLISYDFLQAKEETDINKENKHLKKEVQIKNKAMKLMNT